MAYENVGLVWTANSFEKYLSTIERPAWCQSVVLHHTAAPSLAQRPKGILLAHIENLRNFYRDQQHWSAGPHLFIDEDEIFGMCDLRQKGVHAASFNRSAIGIEVLGNYDVEDPRSGRGLACWQLAANVTASLLEWLGLEASPYTIFFHRDDPLTKKTCPGNLVKKDWILNLVKTRQQRHNSPFSKPDVGMYWDKWEFRGERWCVPVYEFLMAKKVPSKTIAAKLKSVGGLFFYGTERLEGAYYVGASSTLRPNNCTWAPAHELLELL